MEKEFKIDDILNAMTIINKNREEKGKSFKAINTLNIKNDLLDKNNQKNLNKDNILVLNEMIE